MRSSYKISSTQNALIIVAQRQYKALLSVFLLFLGFVSHGQTYLISPTGDGGFESGTTFAANGWTTVNPANTALWQIGTAASGYTGSRGAFVGPSSTSYTYTTGTSRTCHFYRDITVPAGATSITLSWALKGSGESGWDRLLVYRAPTSVTPAANIPASSSTTLTGATLMYTQSSFYSSYTTQTLSLPGSVAGTTFRLIFTWQNDASLGTTPPAAVDNISLFYTPATTCSGTPSGITASSTQTYGCTSYSPTLSLAGISGVSGLTFQWQSSADGSTAWTNISGATNATYAPTVTATIYYRCIITCSASGGSMTTSGVGHVLSATASIPYSESFEGITANNALPSCMAATNINSWTYTYIAATGSYNQFARTGTKFGSFRYGCNDWFFTPAFALTSGNTYVFSFWYITDGYSGWGPLQAKYGTSQTAAGMTTTIGTPVTTPAGISYAQYSGTFTATSSGNFYIGINCVGNGIPWYLSIDDINLTALPACSGTPTAGTVSATVPVGCGSFTSDLSVSGATSGVSGLTYQWQSSTDGGVTWGNMSGATNLTYTPTVSATTQYRRGITCVSSTAYSTSTLVSVNPVPSITGSASLCYSTSGTLSGSISGGTWVSSAPATVSVGASSGVITSATTTGTATISYTLGTGCRGTVVSTVFAAPTAVTVTPTSPSPICLGASTTFTAAATAPASAPGVSLIENDFNSSGGGLTGAIGGTWTIVNTGATSVYNWAQVNPGQYTDQIINGDGSKFMEADANLAGSGVTLVTQLRTPSFSTLGYVSATLTYNYYVNASWSSDYNAQVDYSTNGGSTWTTLQNYTGTTAGSTTWSAASPNQTITLPAGALNQPNVMIRYYYNSLWGFYYAIDNVKITGVPPATYTWTGISGAGGLSCTGCASPVITPAAAGANVYSVVATANGCTSSTTVSVSVNPLPPAIAGAPSVCAGLSTSLTNSTSGGTWQSSTPAQGTVNSTSGVFTGISAGTTTVSYTLTSTGCRNTRVMNVDPLPANISGTASVCSGSSTSLTSATGAGSWTSSSPAVAAITSSGVVTGSVAGVATITYTLPTSCLRSLEVTVNPLPSINVTPATATVCAGDSALLSVSSPALEFSLLIENFNTGPGVWTVTTTVDPGDGLSPWNLVSSSSMLIGGDGTAMMEAAPSASTASGLTKTYLTSPSFSTVGFGSANLTFNEHLYSSISSDMNVKVQYSLDGGTTWTTFIDQMPASPSLDTSVGSGSWDAAEPEVDVPLPAPALNVSSVKLRWFYETNWGGWWEVDNIAVKAALPAATFTWTGVSGATGLSCSNCATPKIAPSSVGGNVYNVTANSTCSSNANVTVNVNPLPGTISGASATLCVGSTINLSNPDAGGTWSSTNASVASVDASTGIVSGNGIGSAVIAYVLPSMCARTVTVNVDPAPAPILGTLEVCDGLTTALSHAVSGGMWSSSASVVYIDASSGMATGSGVGNAIVTYVLPSGCKTTAAVTVNQLPSPVSGTPVVCSEATTILGSTPSGGTWTSNDDAIASFVSAAGEMTGMSAGLTSVTYTLPTGCLRTAAVTVNAIPANITGAFTVCEGQTTSLGNTSSGGNWSNGGAINALVDGNGVVSGIGFGTTAISYMLSNGCYKSVIVTVNQAPAAITGTPVVCEEATSMLASAPAGGSWLSNDPLIADFITSGGQVSGVSDGTALVSYTLPTGCRVSTIVTVNALPADIAGTFVVCEGLTTALNNITPGGSWGSSDGAIANVNTTGVVDAVSGGNVNIIYTLGTGCYKTASVTVNALPGAINGTREVCEGLTTLLTSSPAGGTWDGNTAEATINTITGEVSGMEVGVSYVSYILPTGCLRSAAVTVNTLPGDISGTLQVCQGLTTSLGNSMSGGQWTSSLASIADVDVAGVVTGVTDGTARVTYTIPATGCLKSAEVLVNPLPVDIAGTLQVCEGLTTALSNGTPDGSWSASPSSIASINAAGVVNGISAGTEVITYTLPTGCLKTADVLINPLPADITGTLQVCEELTTNLFDATADGSWTGGSALVATIDGSGVVSALNAGTTIVTYTLDLTGCRKTAEVLVNPLPADITGVTQVCQGSDITLTDATPGGNWSSLSTNATVDAMGVVSGGVPGSTTIVYLLPTGCLKATEVTINALPDPITGIFQVCEGATTSLASNTLGGSWSSSAIVNASIDGDGVVTGIVDGNAPVTYSLATGCIRTADVAVHALPSDIEGIPEVCEGLTTTLVNNTVDGVWSTDASSIAGVNAFGVVSGLAHGNANIVYTLLTGCAKSINVTVNSLPDPITGAAEACEQSTATLINTTASGSWLTSSSAIAEVDMSTGIVTGVNAGVADISYVLSTGCMRSVAFTVKTLPADISGAFEVCAGLTTALNNTDGTGSWSSSDLSTATVDAAGVVMGGSAGTVDIIYTLPNGCAKSANVLVNSLPEPIAGIKKVCESSTTSLNTTTPDGIWTSSSMTTADVDILSGIVSGISSGTATVTYALMTGCIRTAEVTVNALPAPVMGITQVCQGLTTALSSGTTSGSWSTSSTHAAVDAAGVVTGVAAGSADVVYALANGCRRTANVVVNPLPDVHNVTGGGPYCAGTGGVAIGGDNSDMDIAYQLYNGSSAVGGPIVGGGSLISFGMQAAAGIYSVLATDILTGCVNGMAGSATVTILPLNIPSVAVASGLGTAVCAGTSVSYNATPVNGGTLPAYTWEVNGVTMPATSSSFSYVPANGDLVKVTLTSNASCAIPATATSMLTMTVNANQAPVATIAMPAGVLSVCKGSNITLTAGSLYGGSAPVYDWFVNSTLTATGPAFTFAPNNGDLVTSKLTSNYTCLTTPAVMSNTLTMATNPVYIPVISIGVSPGASVPAGTTVTFTSVIGGTAGPSPSFQWYKNGGAISGATNAIYMTSTLANSDSISCKVTGTSPCGYESFNSILMRVKQTGVGQLSGNADNISLVPNPNKGDFIVKGHLTSSNDEELSIEVTNLLGQTVYRANTTAKGGKINERIQLNSSFANGMYMLNLRSGDESMVFHFVLEQ